MRVLLSPYGSRWDVEPMVGLAVRALGAEMRVCAPPVPVGPMVTGATPEAADLSDGQSLRAEYLVGGDGGRSPIRKTAGIAFPGWHSTTSHLIAKVELAEKPEWSPRRDALGMYSLSSAGDGGPVRRCDVL